MTEREKLIEKINDIHFNHFGYVMEDEANEKIADFILEDRKRLVQPILELPDPMIGDTFALLETCRITMRLVLKNAGINEH